MVQGSGTRQPSRPRSVNPLRRQVGSRRSSSPEPDLGQGELVAGVEVRRAGQREQEQQHGQRPLDSPAGRRPGDVVVAVRPGGTAALAFGRGQVVAHGGAEGAGVERGEHHVHRERLLQLVRPDEGLADPGRAPDLGDAEPVGVLVEHARDPAPHVVHLGPLAERVVVAGAPGAGRHGRVAGCLGERAGGVEAEPVEAAVEPEPHGALEVGGDVGVVPVEVGLLDVEQVEVPVPVAERLPRRPAEQRLPVRRRGVARRPRGSAPGPGARARPRGPRRTRGGGSRCGWPRRRRRPGARRACARATRASTSASVPIAGSTARWSTTSYPASASPLA